MLLLLRTTTGGASISAEARAAACWRPDTKFNMIFKNLDLPGTAVQCTAVHTKLDIFCSELEIRQYYTTNLVPTGTKLNLNHG